MRLTMHVVFRNLAYSNAFFCVKMSLRTLTLMQRGENSLPLRQRPQKWTLILSTGTGRLNTSRQTSVTLKTEYRYLMFIFRTIKRLITEKSSFLQHKQFSTLNTAPWTDTTVTNTATKRNTHHDPVTTCSWLTRTDTERSRLSPSSTEYM